MKSLQRLDLSEVYCNQLSNIFMFYFLAWMLYSVLEKPSHSQWNHSLYLPLNLGLFSCTCVHVFEVSFYVAYLTLWVYCTSCKYVFSRLWVNHQGKKLFVCTDLLFDTQKPWSSLIRIIFWAECKKNLEETKTLTNQKL